MKKDLSILIFACFLYSGLCLGQASSAKAMNLPRVKKIKTSTKQAVTIANFTKYASRDENGKCLIHHQLLRRVIVPIYYGHMLDIVDDIGRDKNFPNATDYATGGCIYLTNSKKQALVLQCQQCFAARDTWRREFDEKYLKKR